MALTDAWNCPQGEGLHQVLIRNYEHARTSRGVKTALFQAIQSFVNDAHSSVFFGFQDSNDLASVTLVFMSAFSRYHCYGDPIHAEYLRLIDLHGTNYVKGAFDLVRRYRLGLLSLTGYPRL